MAGADGPGMEVSVAYATPERQRVIALEVSSGTTAIEAVRLSGILAEFPQIDMDQARLGVFGRRVTPDHVLGPGDRVEVYRPLTADPKSVRRERAKAGMRSR